MAVRAVKPSPASPHAEQVLLAMDSARQRTLAMVAPLTDSQLECVHSSIMSPLVWDLGHIAAYEDLWIAHRLGGLELLRPELAQLYDAFETPRAVRGEIEALAPEQARSYMAQVRARTAAVAGRDDAQDSVIWEMVLRHELQHCETMRQTMAIAGLLSAAEQAAIDEPFDGVPGERWLQIPAGTFAMGADGQHFSYDNERPQHPVDVGAFAIAHRPVSNASWLHFSEGGGYERREWWSDEGWAWKEEYDITHHRSVATGHPQAPVSHVSWFEADAFARAHNARLPTEIEWERATTWSHETAAPLEALGRVWEWTASHFSGYPGFEPYPYREYSQVFFGEHYRVLRGSSWATDPRVASLTFRNWDLPQRRQIFAGVRLVKEEA
jgi:iron(II)-dependent oxidoreductase